MKVGAKIAALSISSPPPAHGEIARESVMTLSESLRTTPRRTRSSGRSALRYTRGFFSHTRSPLPSSLLAAAVDGHGEDDADEEQEHSDDAPHRATSAPAGR